MVWGLLCLKKNLYLTTLQLCTIFCLGAVNLPSSELCLNTVVEDTVIELRLLNLVSVSFVWESVG